MNFINLLNYKIIDTSSRFMQEYNAIYIPFNGCEACVWLFYIPRTIWKYWEKSTRVAVMWQCTSFALFALSDVIEMQATTPLLIMFKVAILISLIVGHRHILATKTKIDSTADWEASTGDGF